MERVTYRGPLQGVGTSEHCGLKQRGNPLYMASCEKDLIDIMQGLLVPVIALLGVWIAFHQWNTNRLRLQHELFDRRFKLYEEIINLFASVLGSHSVNSFEHLSFFEARMLARFLFGEDIAQFLGEVTKKLGELEAIQEELNSRHQDEDTSSLHQRELDIRHWFHGQLEDLETMFDKYMCLSPKR